MIKIPRLPWDEFFMLHAHLAATRATCDRGPNLLLDPSRHGVGAVLVRDRRIIAGGYNGSAPGQPHCCDVGHKMVEGHCVRTIHAERNALMQCALDGISPVSSTLYVTASPCWDCSLLLIRAGVLRVVMGVTYDSRYELSSEAMEVLKSSGITIDRLSLSQDSYLIPEFVG